MAVRHAAAPALQPVEALRSLLDRLRQTSPADPVWWEIEAIAAAMTELKQTKLAELRARLDVRETLAAFWATHETTLRYHEFTLREEWHGTISVCLRSEADVTIVKADLERIADLLGAYDQLNREQAEAPNRRRAREIRTAQDKIAEELEALNDHVESVLSEAEDGGATGELPEQSTGDVPEHQKKLTDEAEPADQKKPTDEAEPEDQKKPTDQDEFSDKEELTDKAQPEDQEELTDEPESEDQEEPQFLPTASDEVTAVQLVEAIEAALRRPDAAIDLVWPAVRYLERAGAPQVGVLPPSETIEAAFVLEQYQADGVPAHRERIEQLIGAIDGRLGSTPQQAAAVVLSGGAAVLIAGTDSVGWASGAVLSADPSAPSAIAAWYREISNLQRRLTSVGVTGSPLAMVSRQDGAHRQAGLCTQLETLFQQLRLHFFPFQVGNRFLRAAFPVNGSGRLDFLLDLARAPRPDLDRLRHWHEEFDARVFMADVLRQVRGPRNDEATIHAWAERYILDRLDAIHGAVGELVGLRDNRTVGQIAPIEEQLHLLRTSTREWLRELSVPGDDDWRVVRCWAVRVLSNVLYRLEGV